MLLRSYRFATSPADEPEQQFPRRNPRTTMFCLRRALKPAPASPGCGPRALRGFHTGNPVRAPAVQVWLPETTENGVVLLRTRVRETPCRSPTTALSDQQHRCGSNRKPTPSRVADHLRPLSSSLTGSPRQGGQLCKVPSHHPGKHERSV